MTNIPRTYSAQLLKRTTPRYSFVRLIKQSSLVKYLLIIICTVEFFTLHRCLVVLLSVITTSRSLLPFSLFSNHCLYCDLGCTQSLSFLFHSNSEAGASERQSRPSLTPVSRMVVHLARTSLSTTKRKKRDCVQSTMGPLLRSNISTMSAVGKICCELKKGPHKAGAQNSLGRAPPWATSTLMRFRKPPLSDVHVRSGFSIVLLWMGGQNG